MLTTLLKPIAPSMLTLSFLACVPGTAPRAAVSLALEPRLLGLNPSATRNALAAESPQ